MSFYPSNFLFRPLIPYCLVKVRKETGLTTKPVSFRTLTRNFKKQIGSRRWRRLIKGVTALKSSSQDNVNSTSSKWEPFLKQLNDLKKRDQIVLGSHEPTGYFRTHYEILYPTYNKGLNKTVADKNLNFADLIQYLNKRPENGIGCNFSAITERNRFIVLDIDNSYVGQQIINWSKSSNKQDQEWFTRVFYSPIVIETETPGNVHLWYRRGNIIDRALETRLDKKKFCTLLGFEAEYTWLNINVASQNRTIVKQPSNLADVSILPKSLYPFRFEQKKGFFSLTNGVPLDPNCYGESSCIPEGRRNESLYLFTRVANFSKEHVLAINRLLCKPMLIEKEVVSSCADRFSRDFPELEEKTHLLNECNLSDIDSIEFNVRANENLENFELKDYDELFSKIEKTTLKMYKFNMTRAYNAKFYLTPFRVISLIAFLESARGLYFESDDKWMGFSLETVIVELFLETYGNRKNILFVNNEKRFYLWEKTAWKETEEMYIENQLADFVKTEIKYAGIEATISKFQSLLTILRKQVQISMWPRKEVSGFNCLSGIVIGKKDENGKIISEVIPHNPNYYHKYTFPAKYDKTASLNPLQARFILEFCGENQWAINVFRFLNVAIFTNNSNQIGWYLNGPPGSAKSLIVKFFQLLFDKQSAIVAVSTGDIKKESSFITDFSANRLGLIFPEIGQKAAANENLQSFLKQKTAGDRITASKKFKHYYEDDSMATIILVSNVLAAQSPLFKEEALVDRLIDFVTPQINSLFKIADLETFLNQNLSGFLNWILQSDVSFLDKFVRAKELNSVFGQTLTHMEDFISNELVYVPNPIGDEHGNTSRRRARQFDYVTTVYPLSDLQNNFIDYVKTNYPSKVFESYENASSTRVHDLFKAAIEKLNPMQKENIKYYRTSKVRGIENVYNKNRIVSEAEATSYGKQPRTSKNSQEKYVYIGRCQYALLEPLTFKKDTLVEDILNTYAFKYHGELVQFSGSTKFYQAEPTADSIRLTNESVHLVASVLPFSSADLIKHFSPQCLQSFNLKDDTCNPLNSTALQNKAQNISSLIITHDQKGPHITESKEFNQISSEIVNVSNPSSKYGVSVPIRSLAPQYLKQNVLPSTLFSITNPVEKNFTSFFILRFTDVNTLTKENLLGDAKYILDDWDSEMFTLDPQKPIKTYIKNLREELIFKQIIRGFINKYIKYTGVFPLQTDLMISVFNALIDIQIYPIKLDHDIAWIDFLETEFWEYKIFFKDWIPELTRKLTYSFFEITAKIYNSDNDVLKSRKECGDFKIEPKDLSYYKRHLCDKALIFKNFYEPKKQVDSIKMAKKEYNDYLNSKIIESNPMVKDVQKVLSNPDPVSSKDTSISDAIIVSQETKPQTRKRGRPRKNPTEKKENMTLKKRNGKSSQDKN